MNIFDVAQCVESAGHVREAYDALPMRLRDPMNPIDLRVHAQRYKAACR